MNARLLLLITATVLTISTKARAADQLFTDHQIRISGVILQQSATSRTGTTVSSVTIPHILAALNITVPNVKNLRYYYDQTTDGYVIAAKGIADGGTGTVVATVFLFGNTDTQWNGKTGKSPFYVHAGNEASGFNGNLSGARHDEEARLTGTLDSLKTTSILSGVINAVPTVVQISIYNSFLD